MRRLGIHNIEELIKTPLEDIAQQRNIGAKTLDEIKHILENADHIIEHAAELADNSVESDITPAFTEEQLSEMSRHSIEELGLSVRPIHALYRDGYSTIDKVAQMSEVDFSQMKGIGKKSIDEIKVSVSTWIKDNISYEDSSFQCKIVPEIEEKIQLAVAAIDPVMHLYWKRLYSVLTTAGSIEQIRTSGLDDIVKKILQLPEVQNKFRAFWSTIILEGILPEYELRLRISKLALDFTPSILVDQALATGILMTCNRMIMISRDTFLDAFEKVCDPDDRAAQILQFRTEGESLQNIGDLFELTRERVRQITVKLVHTFPLLFEDYFSEPYQYFHLLKAEFCGAFPDVAEEGYEYLSIRYQRGKIPLTSESLSEYKGTWKTQLNAFLHEKEVCNDKKSVSKTEMVMRVLISNADKPLSVDEFAEEYYKYIERRGYPVERLKINLRTVGNHLRNARGIVQKLQGNDWMLTCIMRQQDAVASLSVAGGIILSLECASLNLSRICEWIASTHGKMSITNLEHTFNETFGTRIPASKLAEKLRTSGSWDAVVTDSMDEYIDSLVDAGLSDIDADDLLQEEFF